MTDSMKFGPEWLRNMKSSDTSGGVGGTGGTGIVSAPIKMAEFRYGREEMLALFDRAILPPDPLKQMQGLYVEKTQLPLALIQMTEEETRMWNRGINSDAALRLAKPGGPGAGVGGSRGALGGRGGSVDRGRGRARGSYHYSRGLSYDDSETTNGYGSRGIRSYDRTQSGGGWGERNGGEPGDSPRKEFGSRSLSDTNWRRHRMTEDEDGWRSSRSSEKWSKGGSNSWREGESWDRPKPWEETNNSHPPPRKPWENDENNLPEWAMENPSESGGSFDASGAFHGGTVYSDEEEGGSSSNNQRSTSRTEQAKSNSSQPRPAPHSKKEPPNITNGTSSTSTSQETVSGGSGDSPAVSVSAPLRQSQSATSLSTERRPPPHPHPITSSASFSGVNSHTSLSAVESSKPQREELLRKSSPTPRPLEQHSTPTTITKISPPRPVEEPKVIDKTSHEEEIEQRLLNDADVFVSRLTDEEDREPLPVTSTTSPSTPAHPHTHTHSLTDTLWYYQDPQGNVQGPFQSSEMSEWYSSGYFKGTLLVRRACDERYSPLSELIKLWKAVPFMSDYYHVPPIKASEPLLPTIPSLDESLLLQYQLQQRLLLQRQAQAFAKLSQSEQFNSLTALEQQQLLAHQASLENMQASMMMPHLQQHTAAHTNSNVLAMLQQLAQFQQLQQQRLGGQVPVQVPLPGVVGPSVTDPPIDPVQQLMGLQASTRPATTPQSTPTEDQRSFEQFINAFRQRQATSQTVPSQPQQPQPVTMESVWGGTTTTPAFPAWSVPPGHTTTPQSLWAPNTITKGIKTEQEILEEQLRAEEKKKEELRKQEELQRLKEEEEKERLRKLKEEEEKERKRKEEEERERKRVQEEEERKKKEAAAKKAEQDRLRKEEEKKRKEEEKRRKEEEKRKQEEEKKRIEEEKKKLEEEKRKREEMAKKQNEALKRLQEQQQAQARTVKPTPTPAPWTAPEPTGPSLADIQKTERKQQQQLREQQEMLRVYQERHQQEQQIKTSKSSSGLNLKWAETTNIQPPARIKSLAEIQAEEQERLAKQAEKEKAERMAASKEVSLAATASIWATANQSLSWNTSTTSVWGTATVNSMNSGGARFFDEVGNKATKPAPQPQTQANKTQVKTKAKKEEASVMKLFEKQLPKTSKTDEFNKWCAKTLSAHAGGTLDIPTFVDFLLAFESQKEVREYVRMYLGETKEANDFATEFLSRRQRLLANDTSHGSHRPEPTQPPPSNHFQEVKGKNKKVKKNKMTKVDSRILGFNVTAAPDRINVGDRDYGEGL